MQLMHVGDASTLRAYAKPARLRFLDLLRARGPAIVGMLTERSSDTVGSVRQHVKRLARAGSGHRARLGGEPVLAVTRSLPVNP